MSVEHDPASNGSERTATTQAEEALRESEGHLRSLMESAQSFAVYRVAVDPTGPYLARVELASPSIVELLGISDLYDFATWFAKIHPDDLARIVEANRRSLETGVPFDQQFRILKEERGEWSWVHVRSTPVRDSTGRPTHFNGLVVDITEQMRAEEEGRRQGELLAALHETAIGIVSRLNVDELLEAILERALKLVDAVYGFVYLTGPGEDEVEVRIGTGPYRAYVGLRMKRGEGLAGRIYESGQPLAVDNYQTWPGRSPQFEGLPLGPALGTPLTSGTEVVGVLGVARLPDAPSFRQDEMNLIRRFSHLASIALDNARLYSSVQQQLVDLQQTEQALQQRLASEELVARISTEFVNLGPAEIDAGIQHALHAIGQVARVDRSYVFQFSGDGTILDNTHEWCDEGIQPYMDSLRGLPRAAFPWFLGQLEQLEVVSVPRVADMPPEASSERSECDRESIKSIILVPLAYRGTLTGYLGFDSVRSERSWGEDTIALLKIVAGIIVNALEHKRAQAIQAGQRQFLELLATGGDFSEILHTLVRLIENQWPGILGLILLLDDDGKHLHVGASESLPEDYVQCVEGLEIGPMVGSCGTACYRRERVIVEDTVTDPRWDGLRDLALQYNLRACWSEPVFAPDGQVLGTFAMYYRQPRAPTEAELRAIEMGAHLVGVAIEHRRAEKALRESEEKFRGIVEYANVGIAIVQDARFRFVNPHFASMLGYTVEEMLSTEFMGYCAPEERDRIVDFYTRRARGEPVPSRYETAMVHKNGGHVYAEVSVRIIPYGGQQASFVFLRDITEQKRVQDALRNSELRFRAVFEGAPIGISVTSLEAQLLETNRALQQMSGYTGEELYNLAVSEFSHPEDMAVDAELFNELVPGKIDSYQMEKRFIRKSGEMFWGRLSLSLARSEEGEPLFAIATTEDITEQKQAQQALLEAYQTLEQRVQERTRELAALNSIVAVVSRSLDLQEIMSSALDKTLEVMGLTMGGVYRLEGEPGDPPSGPLLRLMEHRGITEELARHIDPLPLHGTLIEGAAGGQPVVWAVADYPQASLRQYMDRAGVQTGVSVPLLSKDRMVGALILGAPSRPQFSPEALSLLSAIGQQVGVAVENARLYEAEQSRREEAERRRQVAEGMREILAVLNSRKSLPEILDFIARQTCRLLDADAAAILRLEEDALQIQTAWGLDADYMAGMAMPPGLGSAGRALATHQPEIVFDLAEAARRTLLEAAPTEMQKSLLERLAREFQAILSVPLIVQGQDYGAITVYYRNARDFSDEDLRLAMGVADQAALAVESARLREQAEQAAAMEERSRLARELHDSVTQSLYSVTMYAEAAARLMPAGQGDAAEYLREARETAQEGLREMRLLIYQLRPPVLKEGGLASALQVRLDSVERRGGIRAELIVEGEDRLPPAIQVELHQIAQEALNNALKHARAQQVQVRLLFGEVKARLEVQDDGVGFDLAAAQAGGGLGLPGMAERVQKVGGRLEINTAPGQGTQVVVEVPTGGGG